MSKKVIFGFEAQKKLKNISEFWIPIQAIGIYLFLGSVLSVVIGVLIK